MFGAVQYCTAPNIAFLFTHTFIFVAGNHGSPNGCTKIVPLFPASSPFVLTVGATSIEPTPGGPTSQTHAGEPQICTNPAWQCNCTTSTNEQIASWNNSAGFDTGGGFSAVAARPGYQAEAVAAYLKSGVPLPPSNFGWNTNGRGYPDMGAVGDNVCIVSANSSCELVGGTSCAAPLIASLMTLLNSDRLNAGKTPLGFFNPVVYQMFAAGPQKYFNNEFQAQTNYGGDCASVPNFGFQSSSGLWSPLVGCGSPNFPAIRQYVANLP